MSTPSAPITVLDNQLGIRAPANAVLAIIGCSSAGSLATPVNKTKIPDVVSGFGAGPLVEAAAYAIERYGLTVKLLRAETGTNGAQGTLNDDGVTGTSTVTNTASQHPYDEYDVVVVVTTGGTIGVAGIKYKYSLDGGETYSPIKALGTAEVLAISEANVSFDLGAGTLVAGDTWSCATTAPIFDNTKLGACLTALQNTTSPWTMLLVMGDMSSTFLSTLEASLETMASAGRNRRAFAHVRKPTSSETEATYLTAMQTAWTSSSAKRVVLSAGYARIDSSVGNRPRYRRPPALAVAPLACSVSEEVDLAVLSLGPLPGVFISDENGNPDQHDEAVNPGLDDERFLTLRTWEGRTGVYVNNPRLFSAIGSDFIYLQYGRIVDLACTIAREEVEPILSQGVEVIPDGTGRIAPSTADAIDAQITGRLSRELVGTKKATKALFALDRTDDVLTTGTIHWSVRVVPLAYIKSAPGTVALVSAINSSPVAGG